MCIAPQIFKDSKISSVKYINNSAIAHVINCTAVRICYDDYKISLLSWTHKEVCYFH